MLSQPCPRQTSQPLAPLCPESQVEAYCLYPSFPTPTGTIGAGFRALVAAIAGCSSLRLDGYIGVDWSALRNGLQAELDELGYDVAWLEDSGLTTK